MWPQVEVQVQDQVFRDEVLWDLADPQNTPYKYASAVCYELGLGWDAAAAVATAVEAQLHSKSEVCISMQLLLFSMGCSSRQSAAHPTLQTDKALWMVMGSNMTIAMITGTKSGWHQSG